MLGVTLSDRYKIVQHLGSGGFGQTYLAEDLQLPGNPLCVVKQLQPKSTDPFTLQIARRLFEREAQVLYQLGNHDQIPRLLAHLEQEKEFYLVQELIEGHELKQELSVGKRFSQAQVIVLLREILEVLKFVHHQDVIHRDIKPSNLIRRKQDGKIVLIDFGAVKQVSVQTSDCSGHTSLTIAIGSPGYMPNEQLSGKPRFCSDIYAVGMIGIQALTGIPPSQLPEDPRTGEILWRDQLGHQLGELIEASSGLVDILEKMVRYDYRQRYQTVMEVLQALSQLTHTNLSLLTFPAIEDTFTIPASIPEATATVSPQASALPSDNTVAWIETIQAPPSGQQSTPADAAVNDRQAQLDGKTSQSLISTPSRSKSAWLIRVGAGMATVVAVSVGIYSFQGIRISKAESQWAQQLSLSKTLTGDSTAVNPVAMTPDGKTLATGGGDGAILLWNLQTGQLTATLKGHSSAVYVLASSSDGQILASGSADESTKIWDLGTGKPLRTLSGRSKGISSLAISPDHQTLVTGDRTGTIEIWNLDTGESVNTFPGHDILVTSLAISPDGKILASSSQDNTIKLWDLKTGQLIRPLTNTDSRHFLAVAISPDGRKIASGSWDGGIRLWDLHSGKLLNTLRAGSTPIDSVTFKPKGQTLVSGSKDGAIRVWNVRTGKLQRTLSGHSQTVNSLAMTPDGQTLVSSSQDKTIKIWRSLSSLN